ncbi:hypothetical protein [Actinoplanes palleronii]|uniref:hypothetical protein n=1 Tax=Actinoplanes palleronii TaxID=113570 RepID=UPI001942FE59|nr:hypothetical protein [Actinoplanes palleronii]
MVAAANVAHLVALLLGVPPMVTQTVYVPGKAAVPVAILAGIRHNRPETVAA